MEELRPGLWRWTAQHPDWQPSEPETPGEWPREVGCVAYGGPDALVLIDPLVDDGWDAHDALVERHGKPVHVLVTIQFHERSREQAVERYGASETVPDGVEPIALERAGETMFWLPEHRALVPGDRLLGFGGEGALRVCPDSWLRYLRNGLTGEELRSMLRERLLGLPVELVLVSHGEPVLENARDALHEALAQ
jgi:hypothetical protein